MTLARSVCHRCGLRSFAMIMSMFDTDMICTDCKKDERGRPDYAQAEAQDLREYADRLRGQGMAHHAESVERLASTIVLVNTDSADIAGMPVNIKQNSTHHKES